MSIKYFIRKFANTFGFDIRRLGGTGGLRTTISESLFLLRDQGLQPGTVIDVGVADGTSELYSSFPESYFLLIEPLEEFEPQLRSIINQYKGSYILAAAGPVSGYTTFNVHPDHLDGSSIYRETMGIKADGYERTVPVIRVDDILADKNLAAPYLIKADVQGAELDVLKGCPDALLKTEAIVLEVSMFRFMEGAPDLYDVIVYMKEHGFVAYDIILGWNRPLDNALGQIDVVFVQENGRFREDHSYSTMEQWINR